MNFTATEIIKRALRLADIANTDFLTHEEVRQYINDAWVSVYQAIINKGIKYFIKEVALHGASVTNMTEYKLPHDLWQICSLKTRTGVWIARKADSENDCSNTYEVVNDTLRLYGTSSDLILTYWATPTFVTFPDKTIEIGESLSRYGKEIVATHGNKVIVKKDDTYTFIDAATSEVLSQIQEEDVEDVLITEDYYALKKDGTWEIYDDDEVIDTIETPDEVNKVATNSRFQLSDDTALYDIQNNQRIAHSEGKVVAVYTIEDDIYLIYEDGRLTMINESGEESVMANITPGDSYYVTKNGILIIRGTEKELLTLPNGNLWPLSSNIPTPVASIDYGYINKSMRRITSSEIDTVFDFPNDLFVSVIAYQLAMSFAAKQNASSEGLKAAYDQAVMMLYNTFDANGAYTRVTNVYSVR